MGRDTGLSGGPYGGRHASPVLNKLADSYCKPQHLPLRYRLAAKLACYCAPRHLAIHEEARTPDALLVAAQIAKDDLFWASKKLLKYGEN